MPEFFSVMVTTPNPAVDFAPSGRRTCLRQAGHFDVEAVEKPHFNAKRHTT
jgi:hypothetical protein